tara:strand:+ start:479 stop:1426 length:948 start_codon:yes stop_codon:yes gene_type:complete
MRTLILNSSNIVANTNNNTLTYKFPAGNVNIVKGQKVALQSLSMYYSTPNITTSYQNKSYKYVWVDGVEYDVIMPDGFYAVPELNSFLQFTMVQNGHYLLDAVGDFVYFITMGINITSYSIEVNCFTMSQALATANGWTITGVVIPPANAWVIPTNTIVPMLHILANSFRNVIGYEAGYYPTGKDGVPPYSQATIAGAPPAQVQTPTYTKPQTFLSTTVPQITPYSSFILTCSLINNNYAIPNNLIYCFAPQGTYGSQFTIAPSGNLSFIDVQPAQYNSFTCSFIDQEFKPIAILDPNMVIMLLITDEDETGIKK